VDLDREINRLYGEPLDRFTAERNAIARELAKEGDDRAAQVKALEKPNITAWAANQLARRNKQDVTRLLKAGDGMRKAHERVLRGRAGPEAIHEAEAEERNAVRALVDAGRTVLAEAGHASAANVDRLEKTLRSAAVDDEARELLKAGRLKRDVESVGFGALSGIELPTRPQQTNSARAVKGRRDDEARRRRRDLEQDVKERRQAAQKAEREAARTEAAAAKARRAADDARNALRRAEDQLESL
jgi:hypothetical protein